MDAAREEKRTGRLSFAKIMAGATPQTQVEAMTRLWSLMCVQHGGFEMALVRS
jgi:hypothetical protein